MVETKRQKNVRTLETSIELDASIEDVWKALTEPEELVRWFPLEAGRNPDGSLWMSWGGGQKFSGEVPLSEPPHRLRAVHRQPPPGRDPASVPPEEFAEIATEYSLESERGKTILRVVDSGFGPEEEWDELFDATASGWRVELRGLRHYLEHHHGRDRRVAWARRAISCTREQAWDRMMSRDGLLAEGNLDRLSEGDDYAFTAATGDRFEGVVQLYMPPSNFVASMKGLNNALLRVRLEEFGRREAQVWLSTYEVEPSEVDAFQARWDQRLERLFPEV